MNEGLPSSVRDLLERVCDGRFGDGPTAAVEILRQSNVLAPVWRAMRSAAPTEADFEDVTINLFIGMMRWKYADERKFLETRRAASARAWGAEARIRSLLANVEDLLSKQAADFDTAREFSQDLGKRLSLVKEAASLPARTTMPSVQYVAVTLRQTTSMRLVSFMAEVGQSISISTCAPSMLGKTKSWLPGNPPAPQWAQAVERVGGAHVRAVGLTDDHIATLAAVALGDDNISAATINKLRNRHLIGYYGYGT